MKSSSLSSLAKGVALTFPIHSAQGKQMVPHYSDLFPSSALSMLGLSHFLPWFFLCKCSHLEMVKPLFLPLPVSHLFFSSIPVSCLFLIPFSYQLVVGLQIFYKMYSSQDKSALLLPCLFLKFCFQVKSWAMELLGKS